MGDPDVISDAKRYCETVREHTALRKLEAAAKRYFKILDDIEGNESLLEDPDFAEEAKSEIERLKIYCARFIFHQPIADYLYFSRYCRQI